MCESKPGVLDAGEEQMLQDVTDETKVSFTERIHRSLFETGTWSGLGTELLFFMVKGSFLHPL